jgi:hypothetical protein
MNRWVVLAAVAAAASCSSGGGSSGMGGSGGTGAGGTGGGTCVESPNACHDTCDPCSKLTAAQVSMAVGVTVIQGNSYDAHACAWEMDNSSGLPSFQVQFTANIHGTDTGCDETGGADAAVVVTPVSGVGDVACDQQIVGLGTPLLSFSKGCWAYEMAVSGDGVSDATAEADEQALALAVLPNL